MSTPASLLDITVRTDWQEITQRITRRNARLWSAMRIAVLMAALAAQLVASLAPRWTGVSHIILFSAVLWGFPLWVLARSAADRRAAVTTALSLAAMIALAIVLALLTFPLADDAITSPGVTTLGLLILIIGAAVIVWMLRSFPHQMRAWGLTGDAWFANLLIGSATGAAIGFHLLILASFFPGRAFVLAPFSAVLWLVSYQAGLRALGEELLLRGLAFHILSRSGMRDAAMLARLMLLNVFLVLWPLGETRDPLLHLVMVIYSCLVALGCTWLRWRRESIVPGWACHVVFSLFVGMAFSL